MSIIIGNNVPTALTVLAVVVIGIVSIATSFNVNMAVLAKHEFNATLSGLEEVPAVNTMATGEAEFVPVLPNNETIDFGVNTTNIEDVTAGHIHKGIQHENGPVVVTLFEFAADQNEVSERGTITAEILEGPMEGMAISDLLSAMKNESTYINIYTAQYPDGEIRGQIISSSS